MQEEDLACPGDVRWNELVSIGFGYRQKAEKFAVRKFTVGRLAVPNRAPEVPKKTLIPLSGERRRQPHAERCSHVSLT